MLKGIDISNWQDGIRLHALASEIDFVIVKATEGNGYTDPCCDGFVEQAKDCGLLWGFYHFARENSPEDEAEYFYRKTKNYFGHGIPVLDYETGNYDNVEWCERFIERLHDLSGVWPILYMSASRCGEFKGSWIPEKCGFWCAGYPKSYTSWPGIDMPYNTHPFDVVALWQFTSSLQLPGYSGSLDGDYAYMNEQAWLKYACCADPDTPADDVAQVLPVKSYAELVQEVLAGKWGNGDERRKLVTAAGYDYDALQDMVNTEVMANEVIAGKWGNGWNRKQALESLGYNYDAIQKRVNEILEG